MDIQVKCASCGGEVPAAKFCDQCGARIIAEAILPGTSGPGDGASSDAGPLKSPAAAEHEAREAIREARRKAERDAGDEDFLRKAEPEAGAESPRSRRKPTEYDDLYYQLIRKFEASPKERLFAAGKAYDECLQTARKICEGGRVDEALGCLAPEVVLNAPRMDSMDCGIVAEIYKKAGRVDEFVGGIVPETPGEFFRPYAEAFDAAGFPKEALALLKKKPGLEAEDFPLFVLLHKKLGRLADLRPARFPDHARPLLAQGLLAAGEDKAALEAVVSGRAGALGRQDYAAALRACAKLGDFARAAELFGDLEDELKIKEAPELYYLFALVCEKAGRIDQAKELYQRLVRRVGGFRDAQTRIKNLETVTTEDRERLSTVIGSKPPSGAPAGKAPSGPPPKVIAGKFELRDTLGVGGMGYVYKAWERALSREVAVKRMKDEIALDPKARERFLEEARTVAALSHPYIVKIIGIEALEREAYLIFEYVDGETLQQILAGRGRLPAKECARILEFVCQALEYAHRQGVVHRDLKPGNVMLDRQGYVKVMDFGLAAHVGAGGGQSAGTVVGTPPYMAPERYAGEASPRSDVFELGAMLYEMAAGALPFPGPDYRAQKERGLYAPLPQDLPAGLKKLAELCLKADPAARPQSMREVAALLRGW